MNEMSPIEVALAMLKGAAAIARGLGASEGAMHGAIMPAEAAAIDLEVDALEEAKLAALAEERGK